MLINKIEKLNNSRAAQKRALAQFILQNKQDIYRMSLEELSSQSTVSVSTILRTIHSLGFSSYSDFREAFYDSLRVRNKTDEWLAWCENLSVEELFHGMIKKEQEDLSTLQFLDSNKISKVINKIATSKKVYVLGQNASAPMASLLSYELGKVRRNIFQISYFDHSIYQLLSNASGEIDLAIVFAFPRYPLNILKAVRYLKDRGVFIIAIGHSEDSIFKQLSDIFLEIHLNYFGFTTGYSSIMTLLNFIVLLYCCTHPNDVKSCIHDFEHSMIRNEVFLDQAS